MKKKFDIIKYIKGYIKMYDDGKEVTNNSIKGFDFDGNPQTYYVVGAWCREEED